MEKRTCVFHRSKESTAKGEVIKNSEGKEEFFCRGTRMCAEAANEARHNAKKDKVESPAVK